MTTSHIKVKTIYIDLLFVAATVGFFHFVLHGWTVASSAQQMASYFPWRTPLDNAIRTGFPQSDFADSFWPHWNFLATQLKLHHLPLWYPFDFGATRAPETGLFGFYYPIRLVISSVLGTMSAHTAMIMLHEFLSLAFMYRFLKWLKCSTCAAIMGALIWAFNGHNIYYMSLEFPLVLSAWLPLALWAARRAAESGQLRWAVVSGVATGLTFFCGYANYIYAFGLVSACWWIYVLATTRTNQVSVKSSVTILAGAAISALCVGAAYWLPFVDVFRTSIRAPASMASQLGEAITLMQFLRGMVANAQHGREGNAASPAISRRGRDQHNRDVYRLPDADTLHELQPRVCNLLRHRHCGVVLVQSEICV
ncbi:hypothetical protein ACFPTO_15490 [Paraburkholderia denitrificans]|uniref:Glycosyltransferase RgtA/B/C/D-like domain-containing protein n=1 Tax=Paraburkholderia denitrificans TaxID=694025 RepID=A0ABW0JAR3_9BURK